MVKQEKMGYCKMKAVILAAGVNSRLREVAKDVPKCLLRLGSTTIVEYQIKLLTSIGRLRLQDIYVIGGYKIEKLDYLKDFGVNVVYNPKYNKFNNIYSFNLANKFIDDDFILFNGDTLADSRIFESLVNSNHKTAFVIDNFKKLGREEMKVIIKDDKILKFGKEIDPKVAQGEYIGYAKFGLEDARVIFGCMRDLLKEGKTGIWYENAINYVLDKINAFAVYTNGLPWIEIDTPQDYNVALKEIIPKILKPLIETPNSERAPSRRIQANGA
jgi:choline kinase